MADWDDFDYTEPVPERKPDQYVISARQKLKAFFGTNDSKVFFGNQLAVQNEDTFFHWVTHRAINELIDEGVVSTENRELAFGGQIKLLWDRSFRYYKREAKKVIALVEEYGNPNIGGAIGLHGEQMLLGGFARKQFVMRGHNTRQYEGKEWTKTNHNLDFIFERDEIAYGVELKIHCRTWSRANSKLKFNCVSTWASSRYLRYE
jgi:hypothetical protein